MKAVLTGGTGQLGRMLERHWRAAGHDVVVIGRRTSPAWDGRSLGPWADALDGADLVVNLAGRTVNCRYTAENLRQMMSSRVDSTRVVGEAVAQAKAPPRLWLQMSTATIYAHRFDADNDEEHGEIGGSDAERARGAPQKWTRSVAVAKAWEQALSDAPTPSTRKVALRATMVMSPDAGGIFDVMSRLTRFGLGGAAAGGAQYVSWIHDVDVVRAVDFLVAHEELSGPVNLASPTPLPQRDFNLALRAAWNVPIGLPASRWMLSLGAFFMRSETELLLKSRRVVPGRLVDAGFSFHFPTWPEAAADLVARSAHARA